MGVQAPVPKGCGQMNRNKPRDHYFAHKHTRGRRPTVELTRRREFTQAAPDESSFKTRYRRSSRQGAPSMSLVAALPLTEPDKWLSQHPALQCSFGPTV